MKEQRIKNSLSLVLLIEDKICPKDLGIIPCNYYTSIRPTIECVLPQPV
jgi:hypothetical protein